MRLILVLILIKLWNALLKAAHFRCLSGQLPYAILHSGGRRATDEHKLALRLLITVQPFVELGPSDAIEFRVDTKPDLQSTDGELALHNKDQGYLVSTLTRMVALASFSWPCNHFNRSRLAYFAELLAVEGRRDQ